jgi:hypothetical protein
VAGRMPAVPPGPLTHDTSRSPTTGRGLRTRRVGIGEGTAGPTTSAHDPDEGEAYERKQAYEVMLHRT